MIVKLLTEHQSEFLSLKGGCRGSSLSSLVKMSNCWKSHAAAQFYLNKSMTISDIYNAEKNIIMHLETRTHSMARHRIKPHALEEI